MRKESKRLVTVFTAAVLVLLASMMYLGPTSTMALFTIVAYVGFASLAVLNFARRMRGFKRKWREEHGEISLN